MTARILIEALIMLLHWLSLYWNCSFTTNYIFYIFSAHEPTQSSIKQTLLIGSLPGRDSDQSCDQWGWISKLPLTNCRSEYTMNWNAILITKRCGDWDQVWTCLEMSLTVMWTNWTCWSEIKKRIWINWIVQSVHLNFDSKHINMCPFKV